MLINVVVIHIVDSGYFWLVLHVDVGMELVEPN